MKLDILTIAFLTSLLMLAQTLVVFVQFRINRTYKGIGWWLTGSVTQAIGFIIMSLLHVKNISFIVMFANPLVFAGQTFLYIGVIKLMNIKETKWIPIMSNIVFNIFYFYFIFLENSITGRTAVVMTGVSIISMITAYRLFFKCDKKIIGSARFTASIFFIYGFISLVRLLCAIFLQPIKTYELLFQDSIHIIGFIAPSIITTLWTFGFILIVNHMLIYDNRDAKEEAERAGHAKERFLTSMSHEIRTPLNGIMGMIQIMKFTDMEKSQKKYITTIEKDSKLLLNLLNNILDYSKLKYGKDVLNIEKIDIREMIKELKTFFSVKINPQVDVLFHTEESVPKVIMCDKIKLQEILINLIGNAIKFTDKGYIVLRVTSHKLDFINQWAIQFSVEDTGIGMSKNVIDKLFVEFNQAEGQNTKKYGGTGLGLAISKELVELMGGEIDVNSIENKGTIFSFNICCEVIEENIPRNSMIDVFFINRNRYFQKEFIKVLQNIGITNIHLEESIEELKDKVQNLKKTKKKFVIFINENLFDKEYKNNEFQIITEFKNNVIFMKRIENKLDTATIETIEFPIEQEELYTAIKDIEKETKNKIISEKAVEEFPVFQENILVMVIEDNRASMEVFKEMFDILNCKADLFDNGADAINKMKEKNYDIVITDIELPDMNGFDILKSIRIMDNEKGKHTPIIATTAHILDGFKEKCISAGMNEYMSKPIDLKELCILINKYTKNEEKIIRTSRELEIIRKVEPIAFKDAKISLNKIAILINEDRYEDIKKESHKLKGSFSSIRRKNIENMTLEILNASEENNKEKILEVIKKIEKEIELYENSCNRR